MNTHTRHVGQVMCPSCQAPLPRMLFNRDSGGACPTCDTPLLLTVFPALFADPAQERVGANALQDAAQASCYYHPHKEAVVPCDSCGLFLCSLCATEIGGRQVCPRCLERDLASEQQTQLLARRTLYPQMAYALAIYPLFIPYLTLFTAPAALFIAVRYWKAPGSLVSPSPVRKVLAVVLSSLQIAAWIALFAWGLS